MSEPTGNITTVLDKPTLTLEEIVGSIVLYAIKGTGSDRDNNVSLENIKEWISNHFNSISVEPIDSPAKTTINKNGIICTARGTVIFKIASDSSLINNLVASGNSKFNDDVLFDKDANVKGDVSVEGTATFSGEELSVAGEATFFNVVNFENKSNFRKDVSVTGDVVISKGISARGTLFTFGATASNMVVLSSGSVSASGAVSASSFVRGSYLYSKSFILTPIYDATTEEQFNDPSKIATVAELQNVVNGSSIIVKNATTNQITITRSGERSQSMTIVVNPGECFNYVYDGTYWRKVW